MYGSKGFTLLELIIAIALLAVGFSTLFELLSKTRLDSYYTQSLKEDLFELNNRLVEGKKEGLQESKRTFEEYPDLEEVSYRLGSAEILIYQLRR